MLTYRTCAVLTGELQGHLLADFHPWKGSWLSGRVSVMCEYVDENVFDVPDPKSVKRERVGEEREIVEVIWYRGYL